MKRASREPRSVCGRRDDERLVARSPRLLDADSRAERLKLGLGLVDELLARRDDERANALRRRNSAQAR
jgi:hypothetical protein